MFLMKSKQMVGHKLLLKNHKHTTSIRTVQNIAWKLCEIKYLNINAMTTSGKDMLIKEHFK